MNIWTLITTQQIAGNTLLQIVGFFVIILAALIAGKIGRLVITRAAERLEKRSRLLSAIALRAVARTIVLVCFAIALKLGFALLTSSPGMASFLGTITSVMVTLTVAYVLYALVDVVDKRMRDLADSSESSMNAMFASVVGRSIRITVVILALLQAATILSDKPLTSVIAGLGVGGLAVALAAQDTIKNFFGSLILMGDKPFQVGERIVIDGHDGPVEDVGLRSTRIRTLEGHLVTIPNGELANKTIQNIGRRPYIRRLCNITITYDTAPDKVLRAVEIIKDILKDHEGLKPDFPPRVFFNDFNSASLNILVIYWYHPPNYWDFMAFNERVNTEILTRFNNAGIDFAFPTQTVYLAGDEKRVLNITIPGLETASDQHRKA